MVCVGAILAMFVTALKIIYMMRMGFSFAFGLKLEWAFKFQFWPITQAVCLDMFQLSAFFFFIYDKFFSFYAGYLKYFASEEMKKEQAGRVGKLFSKKVETCQVQLCSGCKCKWEYRDVVVDDVRCCKCVDFDSQKPETCGG